ncbi:MAG: YdcH family protein [Pseudomonadota bacterium]
MVFDTEIETLKAAHRALDERIRQLEQERSAGQLEVQRLKKRKLQLRDRITRLESERLPDIIA